MKLNCSIPFPVNLNCWKHHAGFIKKQIEIAVSEKIFESEFRKILLVIGESQMDLYLGKFSPEYIIKEIKSSLIKIGKFDFDEYNNWLKEERNDYRIISLTDKSNWVLRSGSVKQRYVHIHPARYSPLTVRVKSSTIKTFILTEIYSVYQEDIEYELSFINQIRSKYLKLPPLKSLSSSAGLLRLKSIFNSVE